jgi:hypothetical protein
MSQDSPQAAALPARSREDAQLKLLTDFVVRCSDLRELEKVLGKFNLFRVLRFEHGEIRHSNVLAWLLDPSESHGLRDLFLRRWLMRVVAEGEAAEGELFDPLTFDSCEIRWVEVLREWRKIDLLVRIETVDQGHWIIAIENKLLSSQSSGQLTKYRKLIEEYFNTASKRLFVFLTHQEEEPEDAAYVSASYQQVNEVLRDCVEEQKDVIGPEPRVLLNHYLAILEELFMEDSKVAELARRIYQSHRDALDVIFEHRPDALQNLTDALNSKLQERADIVGVYAHKPRKGVLFFTPKALLDGFGNVPISMICELNLWGKGHPTFYTVVLDGDAQLKTALWEVSRKHPFKSGRERTKQPSGRMAVYSATANVAVTEVEGGEDRDVTGDIWGWLEKELTGDQFKGALSIIIEQLKRWEQANPPRSVSAP